MTKTSNSTVGSIIAYKWQANTSFGLSNETPIFYYTTNVSDSTPPTITITNPANATFNSLNVTLNFTASDPNLDDCVFQNNTINYSLTNCQNITFTAQEGLNIIKVFGNDTKNNTNVTTRNFTVDTILPAGAIQYPTNTTYNIFNTTLNFNFTASDANPISCIFQNNTINYTIANCANFTFLPANQSGATTAKMFINDTANNTRVIEIGFTGFQGLVLTNGQNTTLCGNNTFDYVDIQNNATLFVCAYNQSNNNTGWANIMVSGYVNISGLVNASGAGYDNNSDSSTNGAIGQDGHCNYGVVHDAAAQGVRGFATGDEASDYVNVFTLGYTGSTGGNGGITVAENSGCGTGDITGSKGNRGGGSIRFSGSNITVNGTIHVKGLKGGNGAAGQDYTTCPCTYQISTCGSGGGGGVGASGGIIILNAAKNLNISYSHMDISGGIGGDGGRGGGVGASYPCGTLGTEGQYGLSGVGGRLKMYYGTNFYNVGNVTNLTTGGTIYVEQTSAANNIPTQPNVTASTAYVNQTLTANAVNSTDTDNTTALEYIYQFYNTNDSLELQPYSSTATYLVTNSSAHDIIRIRAKAFDGYNYSTEGEVNATVLNTVPIVTEVTLSPSPANSTDNLTMSYTCYDIDGDNCTLASNFTWYKNDVQLASNHSTLNATNYTAADQIIGSARSSDNSSWSNWTNSTILVIGDKTPPTISNFTLSSTSVTTGSTVTISANCSDTSPLDFVYVEIKDPNLMLVNYSMTNTTPEIYRKVYTTSTLGSYYNRIYCQDGSGNLANTTNSTTFAVTASVTPVTPGGGGGITIVSGNNSVVCKEGEVLVVNETSAVCKKTVTLTPAIDVYVSSLFEPSIFNNTTPPILVIIIIFAIVLILYYRRRLRKKNLKNLKRQFK